MAVQILKQNYAEEVKTIKNAISVSRYRAAKQANTAQLGLYYSVGGYISQHTRNAKWGTGALNAISQQLQQEIPGLKGFSEGNMRKMRLFYEAWQSVFEKRSQVANEIDIALVPDKLVPFDFAKCSQPAHELPEDFINRFLEVGFDSHMRILANVQSEEEKIFYVERCGREFWGRERLKLALQEDLYHQQGTMPNNFAVTLTDEQQRTVAMQTFKENNVLEFLHVAAHAALEGGHVGPGIDEAAFAVGTHPALLHLVQHAGVFHFQFHCIKNGFYRFRSFCKMVL